MRQQSTQFDFGNSKQPTQEFTLYDRIIKDRGSHYSVSIGNVQSQEAIRTFLRTLKTNKHYTNATHHSWAVRISKDETIYESKRDDGETGAGLVILRLMQRHNVTNCIICVTRWFGGTKLMGDRFLHIQNATSYALQHSSFF